MSFRNRKARHNEINKLVFEWLLYSLIHDFLNNLSMCRHMYNYTGLSYSQNYSNWCSVGAGCKAVHSYPLVHVQ